MVRYSRENIMKGTYLELGKPEVYSGRYEMMKTLSEEIADETANPRSPSKRLNRKYTSLERIRKKVDQQNALIQYGAKRDRRTPKKNDESLLPPIKTLSTNDIFDLTGPVNYRNKDVSTPYIGMRSNTGAVSPVSKNHQAFRVSKESGLNGSKRELDGSYENINVVNLSPTGDRVRGDGRTERTKDRKHYSKKSNVFEVGGDSPRFRMTNKVDGRGAQNQKVLPRDNFKRPSPIHRSEGTFSIRKKIEQFRQWHEEQYKDKIKKLKQEIDNQYEIENDKKHRHLKTDSSPELSVLHSEKSPKSPSKLKRCKERSLSESRTKERVFRVEVDSSIESDSDNKRDNSAKTWKTWRDANDSYAYKDVKKYIEENDLMSTEKEEWIEKWIVEVDEAVFDIQPGKTDINVTNKPEQPEVESDEESIL